MPHVLVAGRIHEAGLALLRARRDVTFEMLDAPDGSEVDERLRHAEALVIRTARLSPDAVAAAKRLRVVCRHGVGYDNIPLEALNARRIPLAIVGQVNAISVAEHALFMMLELAKRGRSYDRAVRRGDWQLRNTFAATELADKTLLILGFGRIGREVARRARAFAMNVLAYDPYVAAETMAAAEVGKVEDWRAELGGVDVLSVHLPRTAETEGAIGADELSSIRPSAFVINTARGGIIDEVALVAALREGRLAGAGIDAFEREPPNSINPLLSLENLVLSPHSAGLTLESAMRMAVASAENALAGIDGRLDPELVVNPQVLEP
ncbi:MAG: hydroxyacid dehydrogenase [Alphaproteobacteria bacterium]